MKVLILSQYFDPEPIGKPSQLAIALTEHGHRVQVLTGFPNYPSGQVATGFKLRALQRGNYHGLPILRVFEVPYHGRSALGRTLNYGSFALAAAAGGLIVDAPDVIYVWHPPLTVGLPAWSIGATRRAPFVYDVQDLWPDSLIAANLMREGLVAAAMRALEHFVYARAARLLVPTEASRIHLTARGVSASKVDVLPNWADDADFVTLTPDSYRDARARLFAADRQFVITFAGNIGQAQGLHAVLDAAALLQDDNRIAFRLIGSGTARAELERRATDERLHNVRFLDPLPRAAAAQLLAASDLLLVHLDPGRLSELALPGKTSSYLAAGRPILAAAGGPTARLVLEAGAGVVAPAGDATAMTNAVRDLAQQSTEQLKSMGERGAAFARRELSRDHIVRQLESILASVARQSASELPR